MSEDNNNINKSNLSPAPTTPPQEESTISSPQSTSSQEETSNHSPLTPSPKSPSPNSSSSTPTAPKTPPLPPASVFREENKFISAKELNNEIGDDILTSDDAYENILQKSIDVSSQTYFETHLPDLLMKFIIDDLEERGIRGPFSFFKKGEDFYARIDRGGRYRYINISSIIYRIQSQAAYQNTPHKQPSIIVLPPKKRTNDFARHFYQPEPPHTPLSEREKKYFLLSNDEPFTLLGCTAKRNVINKEPIVNKRRRKEFGINDDSGEKINLVKGQELIVNKRNGDPGIATQGGAFINSKYHNLEFRVTVEATADYSLFNCCSNILGNAVTEVLQVAEDEITNTIIYKGVDRLQKTNLFKKDDDKPIAPTNDPTEEHIDCSVAVLEEKDYHRAMNEWTEKTKENNVQTSIDTYFSPLNNNEDKEEEEK